MALDALFQQRFLLRQRFQGLLDGILVLRVEIGLGDRNLEFGYRRLDRLDLGGQLIMIALLPEGPATRF